MVVMRGSVQTHIMFRHVNTQPHTGMSPDNAPSPLCSSMLEIPRHGSHGARARIRVRVRVRVSASCGNA